MLTEHHPLAMSSHTVQCSPVRPHEKGSCATFRSTPSKSLLVPKAAFFSKRLPRNQPWPARAALLGSLCFKSLRADIWGGGWTLVGGGKLRLATETNSITRFCIWKLGSSSLGPVTFPRNMHIHPTTYLTVKVRNYKSSVQRGYFCAHSFHPGIQSICQPLSTGT